MLKSCCCGIPLKKGTIIIGTLSAIGTALSCIVWTVALILVLVSISHIDIDSTGYTLAIVSFSLSILVSFVQFAMAIILVRGAKEEDPRRVRIYLVYGTTLIVLSLISTSVSAVAAAGLAASVVISFVLQAYFLAVIWSYYKELLAARHYGGVDNAQSLHPSGAMRNGNFPEA